MAKKTKFKNDKADTSDGVVTSTATTHQDALQSTICNNTNATNDDTGDTSTLTPEDEQFTVVMNNIVSTDDYIKFIELANKYNLFNGYTLDLLCKQDLICLIGSVINRMYGKEIELNSTVSTLKIEISNLNQKIIQLSKQPETSFDKSMSYSDLMGSLETYKSWN